MKKIFLVLFSLIIMCSVSFGIEAYKTYSTSKVITTGQIAIPIGDLSNGFINDIFISLKNDNTNESALANYKVLIDECNKLGLKYCCYVKNNFYYFLVQRPGVDCDIDFVLSSDDFGFVNNTVFDTRTTMVLVYSNNVTGSSSLTGKIYAYFKDGTDVKYNYFNSGGYQVYDANCDVYTLTSNYWDGVTYAYKAPETDDNEVLDLTDEQIAEIVERFINSNAYLEEAYYNGDYFITYDNSTGYFRGYSYAWNIDLAIEYGNYNEEGEFITTGTKEGEAWRIRPYEFSGDIFVKFGDWLASKFNTYAFEYFSISPDSSIKPRYVGSLEHNYCSNYKENEVVIYSSKQIRYVGEETNSEGKTETVVTDNYIPPTVLKDSETGEEIIIRDNLQDSSDSLENVITPNADFSGLKEAFDKYISFIDISSITWLTTAISSMITIFVPFVALGIIIFLINRILNGGS